MPTDTEPNGPDPEGESPAPSACGCAKRAACHTEPGPPDPQRELVFAALPWLKPIPSDPAAVVQREEGRKTFERALRQLQRDELAGRQVLEAKGGSVARKAERAVPLPRNIRVSRVGPAVADPSLIRPGVE